MADTKYHSPFMGSVTATSTAQSLYTLLQAVFTNIPQKASQVIIQSDTTNGATTLYVGNSAVTSALTGSNLAASQALPLGPLSSNLIALNDLWLLSSSASIQVNVIVVVR